MTWQFGIIQYSSRKMLTSTAGSNIFLSNKHSLGGANSKDGVETGRVAPGIEPRPGTVGRRTGAVAGAAPRTDTAGIPTEGFKPAVPIAPVKLQIHTYEACIR